MVTSVMLTDVATSVTHEVVNDTYVPKVLLQVETTAVIVNVV